MSPVSPPPFARVRRLPPLRMRFSTPAAPHPFPGGSNRLILVWHGFCAAAD